MVNQTRKALSLRMVYNIIQSTMIHDRSLLIYELLILDVQCTMLNFCVHTCTCTYMYMYMYIIKKLML